MPGFSVILPAAGSSTRFGGHRNKVFTELNGRAVWLRSAEHFVNRNDVVQTIVAVSPDEIEWFREKFRPNLAFMPVTLIAGGATRHETVRLALEQVDSNAEFIAVHDAARPLLVNDWIDEVFRAAEDKRAVIPALPISSTIKRVADGRITATVDRSALWAAQTPQVFERQLLLDAIQASGDGKLTDEAQLVEHAGQTVHVIDGWPMNLKITTQADFTMVAALIDRLPKSRELRGLHPFDDEPRGLF